MQADIEDFFRRYVVAFNRSLGESPDFETIRAAFAPCFVAAGPTGIICGQNDDDFLEFLKQGYAPSIGRSAPSRDQASASDVDIVVEMPPDLFQMVHLKEDLEQLLGVPVDLIRLHKHMNAFFKNRIDDEAIYV